MPPRYIKLPSIEVMTRKRLPLVPSIKFIPLIKPAIQNPKNIIPTNGWLSRCDKNGVLKTGKAMLVKKRMENPINNNVASRIKGFIWICKS